MRNPPKAVLFDLDGILLDTEPLYTHATQRIVTQYGKSYEPSLKRLIMGGSAMSGANVIVSALSLPITPEQYLEKRRKELERLFQNTTPIAGAESLVEYFFACGLKLAVATSSERPLFELKSRAHHWFSRFSKIVCGDDLRLSASKPAPDIFLLAASELGVAASECLIFEDSPAGVTAAKRAGGYVIARRDPMLSLEDLHAADLIVNHYSDLDLESLVSPSRTADPITT